MSTIKIKIKGYDHKLVDSSVNEIITQVTNSGGQVVGPVPLPTEKNIYTIIRAVHKYKSSREQFEIRTHKRLIEIPNASKETIEALGRINFQPGVLVEPKKK